MDIQWLYRFNASCIDILANSVIWGGVLYHRPHKDQEFPGKKIMKQTFLFLRNLYQILFNYPLKNYSKYPKSTLEHKWFLSKMLFCRSSVLRNLRFLAKKTLRSRKKGHLPWYFLISSNFCFMDNPQKMPLSTLKVIII